jgi:DNA polymerase I-like protein with 3'-5' exonuclease and polymerase domains
MVKAKNTRVTSGHLLDEFVAQEKPLSPYQSYTAKMKPVYIADQDELDALAEFYNDAPSLGLDLETSGLDPHTSSSWLLSLRRPDSDVVHVIDTFMLDILPLKEVIEGHLLLGANIGFDLKILRARGIRPRRVYDVVIMGRLLTVGKYRGYKPNGDPIYTPNALTDQCEKYLGFRLDKDMRSSFVMHPSLVAAYRKREESPAWTGEHIEYAAADVYCLHNIKLAQEQELGREGLSATAILENRLVPVTADMEYEGIYVDRDMWMRIVDLAEAELLRLHGEICNYFKGSANQLGMFPEITGSIYSINLRSPQQVQRCFADIGIQLSSTDKRALSQVKHPAAVKMLELRAKQKQLDNYGESWIGFKNPVTGRIHSSLNQVRAESGRYASKEPNIQNVPNNPHNPFPKDDPRWSSSKSKYDPTLPDYTFHTCFRSRPGYTLLTCDYSQIELRIAAEVAGDETLKRVIRSGGDVHSQTASTMFNVPIEECGKGTDKRSQGKTLNFAVIYGLGDKALAEALGYDVTSSEKIMRESINKAAKAKRKYFEAFQNVRAYVIAAQSDPFDKGYSTTMLGRKRWYTLPDRERLPADVANAIEASLKNQGANTPIQGTSADITKLAMVMIADDLFYDGVPAAIVNCVHDEIVIEVRDDYVEQVVKIAESRMIEAGEVVIKSVPVEIDYTVAGYWTKE